MKLKNRIRIDGGRAFLLLTRGLEASVDVADVPLVAPFRWHADPDGNGGFYASRGRTQTHCRIRMHQLLFGGATEIDHRDGDGLNNCRSNLRPCSGSQNMANQGLRANNTSGFKGVSWRPDARKWAVRIRRSGKYLSIGLFESREEAAWAYDRSAKEVHGSFARLNFPC